MKESPPIPVIVLMLLLILEAIVGLLVCIFGAGDGSGRVYDTAEAAAIIVASVLILMNNKRATVPATIYLLTSIATAFAGWQIFALDWHFSTHVRVLVYSAILEFAAPTCFLLAGISSLCAKEQSGRARWITAAVVVILSVPLIRHEHGWRLFAEVVGPLVSVVFILDSLARPSAMVITAIATYAMAQFGDIFPWVETWTSGRPIPLLVAQLITSFLVVTSLIWAIASMLATRKTTKSANATPD
jgi:hypothetical protein